MTWTCTVPLPSRDLSPNGSRGHWSKTSRARKAYRELCEAIFRPAAPHVPFGVCTVRRTMLICRKRTTGNPGNFLVPVPLFAMDSYRPTDADNAAYSLKPMLDALTSAGVIKTDRASVIRLPEVLFEYVMTHAEEGVWVEID